LKPEPTATAAIDPTADYADRAAAEVMAAGVRGWRLLPIPARQKKPSLVGWPILATSDPEQLHKWLSQNPRGNWGLATGLGSGIFVVDVDSAAGLIELKKLGKLPPTRTVKTVHGWHFYFAYPNHGVVIGNSVKKLCAGVDVKGENGQVVIPPSIHPDGVAYQLQDDLPVAKPPKWLLKNLLLKNLATLATPPNPSTSVASTLAAAAPQTSTAVASTSVTPASEIPDGSRNNTLASLAGAMQRRGEPIDVIEAALLARNEHCSPPLPASEVQSIIKSISRYEPAPEDEDESLLIIGRKRSDQLASDAERILKGMQAERIFITPDRRLVRIIQYSCLRQNKIVDRDPRANIMVEVDATYLQDALSRSGKVFRYVKKSLEFADAPRILTETMLSRVSKTPELMTWNQLRMLSSAPIMLPDGRIEKAPGYNEASEVWIDTRGKTFVDPCEHHPKLTAKQCRVLLEKQVHAPFCCYPFAAEHPEQGRFETPAFAVVLAAMMSLAARNLLSTTPAYCFDSPDPGSGKTKLANAISVAMTGIRPPSVGYEGAEEFRKHLPPIIQQGDPVLVVDNVTMTMNVALLNRVLTEEGGLLHRTLGLSDNKVIENRAVILVTGNNLQISGDLPRRFIMCRIMPDSAHPESRKFSFDPVSKARETFPQMVMAILAVMRAHMLEGFPGLQMLKDETGSFGDWNRWVRAALVWMGYADPRKTQADIRANDPAHAANEELLVMIREAIVNRECTVRDIKETLSRQPNDLFRFRELTGHKPSEDFSELKTGQRFGRLRDRWFGESPQYRLSVASNSGGTRKWRVEMRDHEVTNGEDSKNMDRKGNVEMRQEQGEMKNVEEDPL
jgi:Bifunctional DNA primase/polymerase, N-terminal/Primase C terminal 1 (PriCT-1)